VSSHRMPEAGTEQGAGSEAATRQISCISSHIVSHHTLL
jgi:hypothetical protein